jgi:predicted nucleotidyltransferase/plasmid maintenance system antidote protein VapI
MDRLGETIRKLREDKELPLRIVAAFLDMDQAILSKIERGHRKLTREQVVKLAGYFKVKENDLLIAWLSDKVVYELEDEEVALQALQMAEEKVAYIAFQKIDRKDILRQLKNGIKKFPQVEKAWIYGSFSRGDDGPKSDVDIALQTNATFTYFDLAEVQHKLENSINRKVDVGFMDSFKPYILEHVKPDLKLIYEMSSNKVENNLKDKSELHLANKKK